MSRKKNKNRSNKKINKQTPKVQKEIKNNTAHSIPFEKVSNKKFFIFSTIFIIALSFAIYANSINNEFTNWDDEGLVVQNTGIRSLSFENLKAILTPRWGSTYQPIRVISYAIDYHFWELNPVGYHLHNILLHSLAAVFLFFALTFALPQIHGANWIYRKNKPVNSKQSVKSFNITGDSTGNVNSVTANNTTENPTNIMEQATSPKHSLPNKIYRIIALLTAVFFIVHPINVESVTWLSSRKYGDLAFFTFLSFFLFVKSSENEKYHPFFAFGSLVACLLAVMSSPFGVSIPALFFLFDYCRDKSNNPFKVLKRRILYYLPFIIFCLIMYPTLWKALVGGDSGGADVPHEMDSYLVTFLTMLRVLFDYAKNLILPFWLNNRYPDYPSYSFGEPKVIIAMIIILLIIFFVTWQTWKGKKIHLFCIGWFTIAWLPASNIIPISTKMADRYIYISVMGPFLYFAYWNALVIYKNKKQTIRFLMYGIILFCVIFFSILSIHRNTIWANSITLFEDSIKKDPRNYLAHYNLAMAYEGVGKIKAAEQQYIQAIKYNPEYVGAYTNLGILVYRKREYHRALILFQEAIRLKPDSLSEINNLALAVQLKKKYSEGINASINAFLEALKNSPKSVLIHYYIGSAYFSSDNLIKAYEHFSKAARMAPKNYKFLFNLGAVCLKMGKIQEAKTYYRRALKLNPKIINRDEYHDLPEKIKVELKKMNSVGDK